VARPGTTDTQPLSRNRRASLSQIPVLNSAALAGWLILVAANLLVGNATTSVWDQDEAAYAGFAADMVHNQNWTVPHFPYSQPHRKPPLAFWMMAGSCELFGVNEFALRLPSVLAMAGTVACIWFGARFLVGRAGAQLAAMVFSTCLLVLNLAKLALTDSVLLCCETVAALALLRGAVQPRPMATVALWAAVAAGLLAKGPPILILTGSMFLFLLLFYRGRRNLLYLHPWLGLPLALLPLAVWIWRAWQVDSSYVLFLGYWYVLRRIGGSVFGQSGPPGTYFVCLLILVLPWTGYLLPALVDAWKGVRKRRTGPLLLGAWLCGGWLIWELLPSKLPSYALGAFPALALLIAGQLRAHLTGNSNWSARPSLRAGFRIAVIISVCLALAETAVSLWFGSGWRRFGTVVPAALMVLLALRATQLQKRGSARPAFKVLLFGSLTVNLLAWSTLVPAIEYGRSVNQRAAHAIALRCRPGTVVAVAAGLSSPSFPFYVQQAGLEFWDLAHAEDRSAAVRLDWTALKHFGVRELRAEIQRQKRPRRSDKDERAESLERVRALFASARPFAFVLDQEQFSALEGQLAGASVTQVEGWLWDRFRRVRYTIVITPSAGRDAADSTGSTAAALS
jgi:4-amino-4-deoxy-L-arabinose transferase-like glycosyltransferase